MHLESWCAMGILATVLAACGSSPEGAAGGIPSSRFTELEGVYDVSSKTENATSCDAEGPSVLEAARDHHAVMGKADILGTKVLEVASCADLTACRRTLDAIHTTGAYAYEWGLTLGNADGDDLTGFVAWAGFDRNDACEERKYDTYRLSSAADGSIRLETRSTPLPNAPKDPDGFCVARPAADRQEAASLPCKALDVVVVRPAASN